MSKRSDRLTVAQAAAWLGRSRAWFNRHRADLAAQNFPPPLPSGLWDIEALEVWRRARIPGAAPAANDRTAIDAMLEQRAAALRDQAAAE